MTRNLLIKELENEGFDASDQYEACKNGWKTVYQMYEKEGRSLVIELDSVVNHDEIGSFLKAMENYALKKDIPVIFIKSRRDYRPYGYETIYRFHYPLKLKERCGIERYFEDETSRKILLKKGLVANYEKLSIPNEILKRDHPLITFEDRYYKPNGLVFEYKIYNDRQRLHYGITEEANIEMTDQSLKKILVIKDETTEEEASKTWNDYMDKIYQSIRLKNVYAGESVKIKLFYPEIHYELFQDLRKIFTHEEIETQFANAQRNGRYFEHVSNSYKTSVVILDHHIVYVTKFGKFEYHIEKWTNEKDFYDTYRKLLQRMHRKSISDSMKMVKRNIRKT